MGKDLRQRATAPQQQQSSLSQLIERMKPEIARALPRHMNPDRMARIATTVIKQTPALARCTPESFLGALMTASQLGLEPGPLGEAYFVPYGREVTFIPGYRGLIKLAYQSGEVSTIDAQVVREGDEFDYGLGLDPYLTHKPQLTEEISKPIAVYAVCIRKDGAKSFRVMSVAEVERIRRRSKTSNNGPWKTDWESMAKKTVIKQLAKFMPLASENFNQATVHDGSVRVGGGELIDVAPHYVEQSSIEAPGADDDAHVDNPVDSPPADKEPGEPDPTPQQRVAEYLQGQGVDDPENIAGWIQNALGDPDAPANPADLTADEAARALEVIAESN